MKCHKQSIFPDAGAPLAKDPILLLNQQIKIFKKMDQIPVFFCVLLALFNGIYVSMKRTQFEVRTLQFL